MTDLHTSKWLGGPGLAVALAMTATPAAALESAWSETPQSAVRLIAATTAVGTSPQVTVGLHFRLEPGWHVYWRSPGDAGLPPRVSWRGSENLAEAALSWPRPNRYTLLGIETVGYQDEVVLPVTARLAEPGRPLSLVADVDYLACADICIPNKAKLSLVIPAGPAAPAPDAHLINRFVAAVPGDGAALGLAIEAVEAVPTKRRDAEVRITVASTLPLAAPDALVEGPPEVQFSPPRARLEADGRRARLTLTAFNAADVKGGLAGAPLTVTLIDGARAAEFRVTATSAASAADPILAPSLVAILGLALLGGLILNLMPCVLPVLSIKLLGVVGHGGAAPRTVRLSFLASAVGILASFAVLAGALALLKAGGHAIGWGIQFQQPWFLVAMIALVTLFACNLWGFFEISLPRRLADLGAHAGEAGGLGGHFLSGALATLLATPCSAPFLGAAVGFALAREWPEIVAVFLAVGIGLALPYLAVAAVPALATRMPRPGRWMVVLRRILGFALAATGVWLGTVLAGNVGWTAAAIVVGLMTVGAFSLYLGHRRPARLGRAGALAMAAVVVVALFAPTLASQPPGTGDRQSDLSHLWKPFDVAAIPVLVAAGRTVFVDVTADWCITCQVNKKFVIGVGDVHERLMAPAVIAMQADWTRPDPAITSYLASFGRYGIPFNVVYGPGAPAGVVLPELLSRDALLAALDRAGTGGRTVSSR